MSLLHATYHRPGGPLPVVDAWAEAAHSPELVEHVVALDDDDQLALEATASSLRVVSPASEQITAVRNWNAAAAVASGDILIVISDDLVPRPGWDATLSQVVSCFDARATSFAVKCADSTLQDDVLLRHPVISRRFYEELGLFAPRFRGVFCDDDITTRAFWHAGLVDGRSVVFDHLHPSKMQGHDATLSHAKINAPKEYQFGYATYCSMWPSFRRLPRPRLIQVNGDTTIEPAEWERSCRSVRRKAAMTYPYRWVRHRAGPPVRKMLQRQA